MMLSPFVHFEMANFPEALAQQAAELCQRLAAERERELAELYEQVVQERDTLRKQNVQLSQALEQRSQELEHGQGCTTVNSREGVTNVEPLPEEDFQPIEGNDPPEPANGELEEGVPSGPEVQHSQSFSVCMNFESPVSDIYALRRAFEAVNRRKLKRICAQDVACKMERSKGIRKADNVDRLRAAFKAINSVRAGCQANPNSHRAVSANSLQTQEGSHRSSKENELVELNLHPEELTFEGFKWLIVKQDIDDFVSAEVATTIQEVRDFYVKVMADQLIAERTCVTKRELNLEIEESNVPLWLEPITGFVIMVNATTIGLSLDVGTGAFFWSIIEIVCSAFFLLELGIKVILDGPKEHFFGSAWVWNWFDFGIVVIAVLDIVFMAMQKMTIGGHVPDLNGVTVVRLVRLLRMARLLRLLRMKIFKELTLMVNGVIGGLKTLCWAFVFLGVLVYILGVLMKQLTADLDYVCVTWACERAQERLLDHHDQLFSTVFRSMVTVFRCLIGDCSAPDGVPLAPMLMDTMGNLWTTGYIMMTCFVLFGVFNLVMAIFVENTLEIARVNQQKRQQARTKEHVRIAQELREIVLMICTRRNPEGESAPALFHNLNCQMKNLGAKHINRTRWLMSWMRGSKSGDIPDNNNVAQAPTEESMQMAVSREVFEEVLKDPKVLGILEDLEISVTNHAKLFDIIDSNGSGQLDVGEIIEGLMKLRGPADKGDVVCAALMVRNVQREMRRFELEITAQQQSIQDTQNQILACFGTSNAGGTPPQCWRPSEPQTPTSRGISQLVPRLIASSL